jgi:hypothetical protein
LKIKNKNIKGIEIMAILRQGDDIGKSIKLELNSVSITYGLEARGITIKSRKP